ncbi:membrane protein [Altererythrobacter sp. B11]|uniref:urate hydroxylase PuuD n=1 Tax=Altererythrobacter sp. B11 TaxID=2060312 RepID=UPI000DC7191D|nr:urate hydroxylase PuuD [Altererythrobacter sp. B11]BBC73829.1 membrane protein [Altererythrobacter sp. B11]
MGEFTEWLNLALRWLHLITGIAWIGSSFYFVWLDNHLTPPKQGDASGELWSVHGGGFYHNEKYVVAPAHMPDDLHWFKWEAYWTWISGFSLLVLVYYVGAKSFLIDPAKADLSPLEASAIGLSALAASWIFYDQLCRSRLKSNNFAIGLIWFAFLVTAAWALCRVFNDRGAYLHVGAMTGTVMVANVFFVIIPKQRQAVKALMAGDVPDPALGAAGKQRSMHNNYMTLPVLFIMISHHYPMTYGAAHPWVVLALLSATGVAIRHVFNLRHTGQSTEATIAVAAMFAAATVIYVTLEKAELSQQAADGAEAANYAAVAPILAEHCAACHSARPTHAGFSEPPLGVVLDTYDHVRALAPRIKAVAVDSDVMPLGNETGMTAEDRTLLGSWIAKGAPQ